MKKVFYPLACCCLAAGVFASCGAQKKANAPEEQKVALSYSKSLKAPETDSLNLTVDKDGYITRYDMAMTVSQQGQTSTITIIVYYSQFNAVGDIVIPQEIIDGAQEIQKSVNNFC